MRLINEDFFQKNWNFNNFILYHDWSTSNHLNETKFTKRDSPTLRKCCCHTYMFTYVHAMAEEIAISVSLITADHARRDRGR